MSNTACKKHGYCPGNALTAGFTVSSAINHKKLHWDNPELNKLRNACLERGVGAGSNFKEHYFVCKNKNSSLDRSESTRSYTILFMLRSQTQHLVFSPFLGGHA